MDVTATELKHRLGRYIDAAMREPVIINKSGRKAAVLMAYEDYVDYEQFKMLNDAYWGNRALKDLKEGEFIHGDDALKALHGIAEAKGIESPFTAI